MVSKYIKRFKKSWGILLADTVTTFYKQRTSGSDNQLSNRFQQLANRFNISGKNNQSISAKLYSYLKVVGLVLLGSAYFSVNANAMPEPVVVTCPVTPLFTSARYDTSGVSMAGATLDKDRDGLPLLPLVISSMSAPATSGVNFFGNVWGKFHYSHNPSVVNGVLANSYNFVRQTPIRLRAGSNNGVGSSAMNQGVETLTLVAGGASAGFTWVVNSIQYGTAAVSADGLSLTIKPSAAVDQAQFDIATIGELMQMDVSRHSSAVTNDNTIFYIDGTTCSDQSDAPSDGSTAPDGTANATKYGLASHLLSAETWLGAAVDIDATTITSAAADGDDDDGVTIPTLTQGASVTIPVVVNQAVGSDGFLQGWIDWNGDGDFNDEVAGLSEQIAVDLQLTNGTSGVINIPINVPINAFSGETFARFRWSTTQGLDSIAVATSGEVEDYAVTINAIPEPVVLTCPATPLFTGTRYDTSSLSLAGGTLDKDRDGRPLLPLVISAMSAPATSGVNFSGSSGGKFHYSHNPSIVNGVLSNSYNFVRQTPIRLRAGSNNGVGPSAMSLGVETLTLVARGTTAGFTWVVNSIQDGTAVVSADGLSLTIKPSAAIDHTQFDIATIGELMQMDVSRHSSATVNDNTVFYIDGTTCSDQSDAPSDGSTAPNGTANATTYGLASHITSTEVWLGAAVDIDATSVTSAAADGDGADDDGVGTLPTLSHLDRSYRLEVNATNLTAKSGRLIAWIDFDGNGAFDSDEAAARVVAAGATSESVTMVWSNIPADIQQGMSYLRLRFTTDAMNAGDANGFKPDGEVEDYALIIGSSGVALSGRVYIDTNSSASIDAGEAGIANTVVVLRDTLAGTCRSVETAGNGNYSFDRVTNGTYEVYQAKGETTPIPQNCGITFANNPAGHQSTTDDVLLISVADADVVGQDFGEVAGITFEPDHQGEVLPGGATLYAHQFTSKADGDVRFTAVGSGSSTNGWLHTIYRDYDCNGELNGTDMNASIDSVDLSVAAGSRTCIIDKVFAPANVPPQDRYKVTTTATFTFAGSTLAGGANATETLTVTDLTISGQATTSEASSSRLKLTKKVENLSHITAAPEALNQANPGDVLRYHIYYRNTGTGSITDLKVNDTAPVYTGMVNGSATCASTPSSMTCAPNVNIDEINWKFTGVLLGGDSGRVSYDVVVDN